MTPPWPRLSSPRSSPPGDTPARPSWPMKSIAASFARSSRSVIIVCSSVSEAMKIAFITTDSREHFHEYHKTAPYFGTAPQALLAGMAGLPDLEVHVLSCLQEPVTSPPKLAENIFYHGLLVSKLGWMRTGYQGCVRAVRRKLREVQPDLVHGQGT